jgi:hypothetical protein
MNNQESGKGKRAGHFLMLTPQCSVQAGARGEEQGLLCTRTVQVAFVWEGCKQHGCAFCQLPTNTCPLLCFPRSPTIAGKHTQTYLCHAQQLDLLRLVV